DGADEQGLIFFRAEHSDDERGDLSLRRVHAADPGADEERDLISSREKIHGLLPARRVALVVKLALRGAEVRDGRAIDGQVSLEGVEGFPIPGNRDPRRPERGPLAAVEGDPEGLAGALGL